MKQATSTNCSFPVTNFTKVKDKVLNWAIRFSTFCFLDNHRYGIEPHSTECMLAAGCMDFFSANPGDALEKLQQFIGDGNRWLFGHLSFDLGNEIEGLDLQRQDMVQFPGVFFFQPETIIRFDENEISIQSGTGNPEEIFAEIFEAADPGVHPQTGIEISNRIQKEEYLAIIEKLKQHILRGDCYEINFCQEFFAGNAVIDPLEVYKALSSISPNPFSSFYRLNNKYLVCASPERFLRKQGSRILSQPIKGTSGRMQDDGKDRQSRLGLFNSAKERSENVMIVDLVRNDLAKICEEGTVKVDELYGIYSFPQVHQMISTVSGELRPGISFAEIIRSTFPMGSMTGAPKRKVLELIGRYEKSNRGIFSGAVGYLDPEGDFDFNVVIRSIMYNETNRYLSFQAGSAITFYSEPEKEWEECQLKAVAIMQALGGRFLQSRKASS